jgi:hypothetical protein
MVFYRRSRESWRALIHIGNREYREGEFLDAVEAIREKWLRWP